MLTIAIPAYNNPQGTRLAVESALRATQELGLPAGFILIDDAADSGESVADVYVELRRLNPDRQFLILKSVERLHYTGSFSLTLHAAQTPLLMFMSNDMILTPSYLTAVLAVASLNPAFGCIRGSSQTTDGLREHSVPGPGDVGSSYEAASAFAEYVFRRNGLSHAENALLCGDAVVIRKSVVEAIGVHDPQLTPYFSDIDYGMRAQLAGFALVGALGAWLHHEGGGYVKREAFRRDAPFEVLHRERLERVHASWQVFRRKWGEDLPEVHDRWDFAMFAELARTRASRISLKVDLPADLLRRVATL